MKGFQIEHWGKDFGEEDFGRDLDSEPEDNKISLITVFSCPNYGGRYKNKGAILRLKDNEIKGFSFKQSPVPV